MQSVKEKNNDRYNYSPRMTARNAIAATTPFTCLDPILLQWRWKVSVHKKKFERSVTVDKELLKEHSTLQKISTTEHRQ